jgi:hypothetical protein
VGRVRSGRAVCVEMVLSVNGSGSSVLVKEARRVLTQVEVVMVAAEAGANMRRHPAETPERKIFKGCMWPRFAPCSLTMRVTSAGE